MKDIRSIAVTTACLSLATCTDIGRSREIECVAHAYIVSVALSEAVSEDDVHDIVARALRRLGFAERGNRYESDPDTWSGIGTCFIALDWEFREFLAVRTYVPLGPNFAVNYLDEVQAQNAELISAIYEEIQKSSIDASVLLAEEEFVLSEELRTGTRSIVPSNGE